MLELAGQTVASNPTMANLTSKQSLCGTLHSRLNFHAAKQVKYIEELATWRHNDPCLTMHGNWNQSRSKNEKFFFMFSPNPSVRNKQ